MTNEWIGESVVVGAGPAGLSAAIGLARAGKRVVVYEQRPRRQERVCGAFLNPEALGHLDWLGVREAVEKEAAPVAASELTIGGYRFDIPLDQTGRLGVGLPRETLEKILFERALEWGVQVRMGEKFDSSQRTPSSTLIVSAAGRFAGGFQKKTGGWFGWNATFSNVRQNPGEMSLHFYPHGYVGVLTFRDGSTNVCGLFHRQDPSRIDWQEIFHHASGASAAFAKQMQHSTRVGEWRGVGPLPFSNGLRPFDLSLPVGDAAAVGDPFMGEGNGRALSAGPMIHRALQLSSSRQNFSAAYRELWNESYSSRFRWGWMARAAMNHPRLIELALPSVLAHPGFVRRATDQFHRGFFVKVQA